jgi:hypothetical protein
VLQLSPLREASQIALTSVLFTALALGILALGRVFVPSWLPAPRSLLHDPSGYIVDHYRLVLRALIAHVGIASLLAFLVGVARYRRRTERQRPFDVVWTIFHETTPRSRPFLDVLTTDGVWFKGPLSEFDVAGPVADRFIAMRAPIRMRRKGQTQASVLPEGWERTIIPLDRVAELHVAFAPPEQEPEAVGRWRTWWRARPRIFSSSVG